MINPRAPRVVHREGGVTALRHIHHHCSVVTLRGRVTAKLRQAALKRGQTTMLVDAKVVILGAGLGGLGMALRLKDAGEDDFLMRGKGRPAAA